MSLIRDRLFLLRPGFEDPAFPGRRFYCWHCALLEGVLASFPMLNDTLHVERVAWKRPRQAVVDLVGADNQSLPLLILADGQKTVHETGRCNGLGLVAQKDAILAALVERHGIGEPHP